jgi:hypothetical protein
VSPAEGWPAESGPAESGPADPGAEVRVDRLALRVTGLDERAARALARLVAEGLVPWLPELAGGDLGQVRIRVTADAAEQGRPELLARRIAGELGRVLGHSRDPGYPDEEAAR